MNAPEECTPLCQGADPSPRPSWFKMPEGACDTHMHIFGSRARYPMVPNRSYTPPEATVEAYETLARVLQIRRTVVVQPSVYGVDNACTLDALLALSLEARAIVAVDGDVSDAELQRLHARGACGIRFNMLMNGGIGIADAERLAERIKGMGWHIEVMIDVSRDPECTERFGRLGVPVVFDHIGHLRPGRRTDDPGFRAMVRLVGEGHCWVKLSGAYRVTVEDRAPYADVGAHVRALLEVNPQRCLWATDWPHPGINVPMPNDGALLDMLGYWIRDAAMRRRILVDNPADLYGFAAV